VNDIWVFPGLWDRSVFCAATLFVVTYSGEGTVVPKVTFVGEAVSNEAKLAFLDVLLNGVQELVLGDLIESQYLISRTPHFD
jgi:hypothetical protein